MKEFNNQIFIKRLVKLMKEKELNIQKLGDAVGLPRTSISNWLNGRRTVSVDAIFKFSQYFNVSADYLIGISDFE